MEFREMLLICATIVIVFASGVTGCTVTVINSNTQYFDAMNSCIASGSTWVPGKGNSEASCVAR